MLAFALFAGESNAKKGGTKQTKTNLNEKDEETMEKQGNLSY